MTNHIKPKGTTRVTISIPHNLRQAMLQLDQSLAKRGQSINWSAIAAEAFAAAIKTTNNERA